MIPVTLLLFLHIGIHGGVVHTDVDRGRLTYTSNQWMVGGELSLTRDRYAIATSFERFDDNRFSHSTEAAHVDLRYVLGRWWLGGGATFVWPGHHYDLTPNVNVGAVFPLHGKWQLYTTARAYRWRIANDSSRNVALSLGVRR